MQARTTLSVAIFCFLATILMVATDAQEAHKAFSRSESASYVGDQHSSISTITISSSSSTTSRRLRGWFDSFIPMSLDSLKDVLTQKPSTTTPSSSLTGLPWIMTFSQQMSGGLPVAQYPIVPADQGSAAPPAPQQTPAKPARALASPQPQQAQQPTQKPVAKPAPASPPAAPPASPPAPTAVKFGCSSTDRSGTAVFSCVNAMRTDPAAWTAHYKCDYNSWLSSVSSPRRPALKADERLASSAGQQAEQMAATRTVSHVGADGSTMAQRISAAGFTTFPQAENVAGRQTSALQVAADWMCSQDHRLNLMSCDIDSVGTATSYDVDNQAYYVQDFGCSKENSACHC